MRCSVDCIVQAAFSDLPPTLFVSNRIVMEGVISLKTKHMGRPVGIFYIQCIMIYAQVFQPSKVQYLMG